MNFEVINDLRTECPIPNENDHTSYGL